MVLPRPVCFEKGLNYTIRLELTKYASGDEMETPYILIDSVRITKIATLETSIQ